MANWRAIRQIVQYGDPRRVAWDKTTHDFPTLGSVNRSRRPLGEMLVAQGGVTTEQLNEALAHPVAGLPLGTSLLHSGLISAEQLARSIAEQLGVSCESVDANAVPKALRDTVPASVALRYAVLPLRYEDDVLVLASESYVDPVSLAALTRRLGKPVRYVLALKGQVTVGLRCWYLRKQEDSSRNLLDLAVCAGVLSSEKAVNLWNHYVSRQLLLGELLVALGHLDEVALRALLLSHADSEQPLGEFLVAQGVIDTDVLERTLALQTSLQPSIAATLEQQAGVSTQSTLVDARQVG